MEKSFEDLIYEKQNLQEHSFKKDNIEIINGYQSSPKRQKSDKSAQLYDLIKMIDKFVSLTMKGVAFQAEEGKVVMMDSMQDINHPIITYKVISRKPIKEYKPRLRETLDEIDDNNDKRIGEVYGQKFKYLLQFNIICSEYKDAEEVMNKFEELIFKYTGFFKKNGVAEIFFSEQITDDYYTKLRETLSVRNLIYYVEIEKLTVIFKERIKEIEIKAQEKKEETKNE